MKDVGQFNMTRMSSGKHVQVKSRGREYWARSVLLKSSVRVGGKPQQFKEKNGTDPIKEGGLHPWLKL